MTPSGEQDGPRSEVQDRYVGTRDLTHWYTPAGRMLASITRRLSAFLGPHATLILILATGTVVAVVFVLLAAQVYDSVTDRDGVAGLDAPLLDLAMTLRTPVLDTIVTGYTDIAGPIGMPILAVTAMVILAVQRRSWTPVILIIAAGTGSLLMTIAGKNLVGRNRPPLTDAVPPFEYSPSFPSGHTLNAVVIAGIIVYLLLLRTHSTTTRVLLIAGAVAFSVTVGLSRIFLGHHWFTDVLAAWVIGAAWLTFIITAHRLYLTTRHHPSNFRHSTAPLREGKRHDAHRAAR